VHRFYAPGFTLNSELDLPEDEAHHLVRVLRLATGARVAVFDGAGNEAEATVQAIAGRRVTVKPIEKRLPAQEPAIALTLGQAILKSDKMDRVIRDAVMLGVAAIQPFTSIRTEIPAAAVRSGRRHERWERTVISSVKQCGRAVVPPVRGILDLTGLLAAERDELCVMCVEPSATTPANLLTALESLETRVPAKATILIGPEGGWDPEEIKEASAAGVVLVSLGQRVLRADAAGALAIAVLQYVWKDI
jgi:16S rRNA (uracil1498-N3)-methyltransferase